MNRTKAGSLAIGVSIAALGGSLAQAATAQAAAGDTVELDEVVVTALKRATNLQDTPLAMSVISEESLRDAGIQSIGDLQNIAPSLQIGRGDFGVTVTLRGVTTTDNTSKGDQGIAFNVDGITIGRPREMSAALFDVSRIEVLRGPQGTLYGKSTTGGVINVITNRPRHQFGTSVDVELGNYDTRRVTGVLNVPVTDGVALRAAVAYNDRDGYLPTTNGTPAFNDQNDLTGRLSALFDFSDSTSLLLTSTFGKIGGIGSGLVPLDRFLPTGRGIAANEIVPVDSASGKSERTVIGVPTGLVPDVDEDFANVTAEFSTTLGGVQLTYLGGYRNYDANSLSAQSLAPNPGWDWGQYRGGADTKQHELRLNNATAGRLNWILGANYYREDLHESDHRWTSPAANPVRSAAVPGIDPLNNTDHQSSGVFGQLDFGLTEELKLTAGARYSDDKVVRRGTFAVGPNQRDANGNPCVYPNDCVGGPNNGQQSANKFTWRLGLDYKPSDGLLFYGSVATGYKAGGFNDFDPATNGPGPYDPEKLTAYELGFKGSLASHWTWNSALFYYDYSAAQISSLTNVQGNVVILTRLGSVKVKGWENDLVWEPSRNDSLRMSFNLMDGKYRDLTAGGHAAGSFPPIGAVFSDWSGRDIDKVSDFTAAVDYTHTWNVGNGASLALRLASRYDSGYVVSNITDAFQLKQRDYTRSDVNLTYTTARNVHVGVYVRNLENKVQILSAPEGFPPGSESTVGVGVTEPRVFGLRAGVSF